MDVTAPVARVARWAVDQASRAAGPSDDDGTEHSTAPVTVTVGVPLDDARALWRDGDRLSQVFVDLADVELAGPSHLVWRFHPDALASTDRDPVVANTDIVDVDERIEFRLTGTSGDEVDGGGWIALLEFTSAPAGLGTEVSLRLDTPLPDIAVRTAAFAVLYRARALLQTGEVPRLTPLPSARTGRR